MSNQPGTDDPRSRIKLSNPWHLLAVGFGSGLSKIVPGTMGTLASLPFYLLLVQLPVVPYCIVVVFAAILGITICQKTSDDMQVHDHGAIVWDEFVGFWITMSVVPMMGLPIYDWQIIAIGFVLFRIFDMVKPWPISLLDRHVHGGFGIMIDDVLAGIFAAISLWLVVMYWF
ncbi:phosphatidylglycerophosphatase A [Vibrio rumoiensis]|uniref:Phosphatidylglycerophosphatase A n=1 Tax=Vibrio rumoiensis 1S-45 TaxID=1188252 RepID=A0A1E5E102_9VIBR|nr:phosphatidylglycerophosphatase A [Vibrio rumoiensis]OEF23917.1 phosphatidylglycerophosphatase A [Vibrio rumoiensis 1S-45]